MLDPAFMNQFESWRHGKELQLAEILALDVPGLQGSTTGHGSLFILRYSVDGFEDSCIIGRPPQQQIIVVKKGKERFARDARTDAERVPEKRKIDLSMDDIRAVVAGWRDGRRAVDTLAAIAARRGVNSEAAPQP